MVERGVPISEAARVMGTSVDALRKRVQRRSVKAYKSGNGQWRVVLDNYVADTDTPDTHASAETRAGTPGVDMDIARRAGGIMAVQEVLAPFIAELGTVREELGREKEKREQAERERDRLRLEIARLQSVQRHEQRAAQDAPARPADDESTRDCIERRS